MEEQLVHSEKLGVWRKGTGPQGFFQLFPTSVMSTPFTPHLVCCVWGQGQGKERKKKEGRKKKYINQMYDVNTCYHGDYGALQDGETGFEKEKDKRGRFVPELGA